MHSYLKAWKWSKAVMELPRFRELVRLGNKVSSCILNDRLLTSCHNKIERISIILSYKIAVSLDKIYYWRNWQLVF